jgi:hypothetical protein
MGFLPHYYYEGANGGLMALAKCKLPSAKTLDHAILAIFLERQPHIYFVVLHIHLITEESAVLFPPDAFSAEDPMTIRYILHGHHVFVPQNNKALILLKYYESFL